MDFGGTFYGEERCVHGVERKGRVLSLGKWERKGLRGLKRGERFRERGGHSGEGRRGD